MAKKKHKLYEYEVNQEEKRLLKEAFEAGQQSMYAVKANVLDRMFNFKEWFEENFK